MADEVVTTTQEQQTTDTNTQTQEPPSPFGQEAWTETIPTASTTTDAAATTTTTEVKETTAVAATQPTIEIPKDWLKKEFDVEDPAILKAEREELKKLKETKPVVEEIKWENEQSKQLHELYRTGKWKEANKIIQTQERLEEIIAGEVTKDNAADIIKMGLQLSNERLTKEDIEFQYKQEYVAPKEPVQKATEDDEDFKERHDEWAEKVAINEQKRVVAAKMAIPELEKAKVKLVLPEIEKPIAQATANEPTKEQLEQIQKIRENFLSKLESDYTKAEGFKTKVKDESVKLEFPVEFNIPAEEKVAIKERLKEQGIDVNDYMGKRWFDGEGNPKIEQIITDIFLLENPDKILSGIANNAANERMKAHRQQTSNVTVGQNGITTTFDQTKTGDAKVSPYDKDAWSEKPPVFQTN